MRVSAGLEVTTLSGKMRIQTLPPRFKWWVMVRLAASICLAVIQAGSSVRMAKSPKAIVLPRRATPPRPPWVRFIILRCFIRLGWSISVTPRSSVELAAALGAAEAWERDGLEVLVVLARGSRWFRPRRAAPYRAGECRPNPRQARKRRRASSPPQAAGRPLALQA